jgi:hypothetical protein
MKKQASKIYWILLLTQPVFWTCYYLFMKKYS